MDPVHPWLDPIEVRRLAERLLLPVHEPAVQVTDAGFGEQFVGYSPVQPLGSLTAMQEAAPQPLVAVAIQPTPPPTPVVVQAPPPPPVPAPVEPPPVPQAVAIAQPEPEPVPVGIVAPAPRPEARGPFLDRVGRFRDWLHHHFDASGIFLLDREGAVIFDESGHGKLHFLARSLAVAARRPGGAPANVHVKVGAAATLEVIPVDTPYGCIVLGAVVPSPMEPAAVASVMDALRSVASPQG